MTWPTGSPVSPILIRPMDRTHPAGPPRAIPQPKARPGSAEWAAPLLDRILCKQQEIVLQNERLAESILLLNKRLVDDRGLKT